MTRSLILVAAILVMGTTAPQAARAARPDSWVTVKAKTALLATEGIPGTAINVDTVDGRVTLHGKDVKANDTEVQHAVEQALAQHQDSTGKDVSVAVKDGVAKLKGTVPNEEARVTAATVARSTPGVRAVLWEALEIGHAR